MNILFVGKRSNNNSSGIEKKMMGQILAFEKLGHTVYYTYFEDNYVWLATTDGQKEALVPYQDGICGMYLANERAVRKAIEKDDIKFSLFYMRKGMASGWHISTLKKLNKKRILVIEEIPTFPYDEELKKTKGIGLKIYLFFDKLYRNRLKKYIDYVVTYSEDDYIFGIPCICINNGIDVSDIPKRSKLQKCKKIRIVSVSAMYYWHGYERLIRGIHQYYNAEKNDDKADIQVDMIGDGPCLEEWKQLVKELGLEKKVVFHGAKHGEELDAILSEADIAVGSLGLYKKNLQKASELKIREYCARGIPFVLACQDLGLTGLDDYVFRVENSDKSIDIAELVQFANSIKDYSLCTDEMREYAKKEFDWTLQIKKILHVLN